MVFITEMNIDFSNAYHDFPESVSLYLFDCLNAYILLMSWSQWIFRPLFFELIQVYMY